MPSSTADVAILNNSTGPVHFDRSSLSIHIERGERGGFKALKDVTAPAAFHNSGERHEPPRCHPDTRKAILGKIMAWVRGEIDTETLVFWLNGSVGVGKSAIAQTIAEMCEKDQLLLASFFFSRSDPTRNNAKRLITTLAYQIYRAIPVARRYIEEVFEHDPLIYEQSMETQAMKLIIEPLQHAAADQIEIPPLIVIDGLDECCDAPMKVLDVVNHAARSLKAPGKGQVIFLVASRPEQEISLKFTSDKIGAISTHYVLNSSPGSEEDIRHFLQYSFDEIKRTHPLKGSIPSSWPTIDDFDALVWKAAGQFLCAQLAMTYTNNIRYPPPDRLATILSLRSEPSDDNPFTELDTLYHQIFSTIGNIESVLWILGLAITQYFTDALHDFVKDAVGVGLDEVQLLFGDLASAVVISAGEEGNGWAMALRHASLEEFLTDQTRSKQYFINTNVSHTEWFAWRLRKRGFKLMEVAATFCHHGRHLTPCQELNKALKECNIASTMVSGSEADPEYARFVVFYIHNLLSRDIRCLLQNFDDAEILYQSQLRDLETHIMLRLERCYTSAMYTVLLSGATPPLWHHRHFGPQVTSRAFASMLNMAQGVGLDDWNIRDPLLLFYEGRCVIEPFHRFLAAFVRDPARSLQYVVDDVKLAAGALALLQYLCEPSGLTQIAKTVIGSTKRVKACPWVPQMNRSSGQRLKKWHKFYGWCDMCATPITSCRDKAQHRSWNETRQALACFTSPSRDPLFFQGAPHLVGYLLALKILPDILAEMSGSGSDKLVTYCQRHVFHPASILFPHHTKIARRAIWIFLEYVEARERWWKGLWLD